MKYKCLIADDNLLERDALEMHLEMTGQVEIAALCANGAEARLVLLREDIDIVFSDIDMPHVSGVDLLKSLKKIPAFVFITSFSEYAASSYELNAVDFLVKPVSFERVARSVDKVIEYIELKKLAAEKAAGSSTAAKAPGQEISDRYFFIRETPDLVKVNFDDVTYIESMGEFSKIFTLSGKKHVTLVSLKNLELQLPGDIFMRIHKQYIVNFHNITSVSPSDIVVGEKDRVPVGTSYRQGLLDKVVNKNIVTRYKER